MDSSWPLAFVLVVSLIVAGAIFISHEWAAPISNFNAEMCPTLTFQVCMSKVNDTANQCSKIVQDDCK